MANRNRLFFWLCILVTTAIVAIAELALNSVTQLVEKTIIYHMEPPSSFDPLEADRASNLPIARMLYLTPIEISVNNELVSTALKSFSYERENNSIHFEVREDLTYSDGSRLEVADVVISITRMLLARPDFPVIKHIKGLSTWQKLPHPLTTVPEGIQVSGNKIEIILQKPVLNPLFRFTLELFSIIPRTCIDLKSNKLKCEIPPASGYYKMALSDKKSFQFIRRLSPMAHNISIPEVLNFKFVNNSELSTLNFDKKNNTVLFGMEYLFLNNQLGNDAIGKFDLKYRYLPYSYFFSLVLNPNMKPFNQKKCRQAFAHQFRDNFNQIGGDRFNISSSLFTPIIPGYLPEKEFAFKGIPQDCTGLETENKMLFDPQDQTFVSRVLAKTYEDFNISSERRLNSASIMEAEKNFVGNQLPALIFGSGFWSLDPVGDLQMMFTPNLHSKLHFAANDRNLHHALDELEDAKTEKDIKVQMEQINLYLHDLSLVNVFLHSRKFYASSNVDQLRELPQQISAPSPWQIFN